RKYRVRVLYVTDHDNNLFFITLKNRPPESITKRFDIDSDNWMITLSPKKGLLRMTKYHTLYIMKAREDHIVMKPGDKPLLNLEMIRPCNITRPERARILPVNEFLSQAYPFATVNHPGLQGSFETEENVDRAFEIADVLGIPLFLEVFNGGVTPIQGYTNLWSEYYHEKHPEVPVFTGSDLHRPDLRPAGIWVRKELLKPAMESRKGLEVNLAMARAVQSRTEDDVIQDKIYSESFKVLYGYVGKKLVG
ncbi:hypothetical protein KY326_02705, partial [Candidatus Woesearchaeota archaeon]|nr:hypothetical protein [Candidatus Woesearchaeota archaeon]